MFVNDELKFAQMADSVLVRVENIVGEGENTNIKDQDCLGKG